MSQPHEKALEEASKVVENVTVIATPPYEGQVTAYTESKRTWKSYLWSCESSVSHLGIGRERSLIAVALDVPKDEARFLTKLDLTLISASALGVMCRYLDQVNITNAFSEWFLSQYHRRANLLTRRSTDSGMKEDLSLYGNELNYANAVWSAAYVFGQIPSNLLLTRVRAPGSIYRLVLACPVFACAIY